MSDVIIPTYAQTTSVEINIEITPTCSGVKTQSSGELTVVLAKVMNY
jgi:hypothetical protein